jgi:hypothetical protein
VLVCVILSIKQNMRWGYFSLVSSLYTTESLEHSLILFCAVVTWINLNVNLNPYSALCF